MSGQKRLDNTLLPGADELDKILETEVTRDLPLGKENVHYPNFDTFKAILDLYQIPTNLLTDDSIDIRQAVKEGQELLNELVKKILSDSPTPEEVELFNNAYDYLSEEDDPKKSDLIFVFGSKTPLRPEKAAEIYKLGFGENVLVSGGSSYYKDNQKSEAENYMEILVEHGVPEDKIIVEDKSITVPDNVRRSLNMLDESNERFSSIILVNSPYPQRRGWSIFKKHLPDLVKVYRVNCGTKEEFSRDNWFKQEDTLRVVLNEFAKMRASVVYNTA